jgi:hypothetical protein
MDYIYYIVCASAFVLGLLIGYMYAMSLKLQNEYEAEVNKIMDSKQDSDLVDENKNINGDEK